MLQRSRTCSLLFFFNDTATTEIYTLSLHDALPIFIKRLPDGATMHDVAEELYAAAVREALAELDRGEGDRKSTRLNSSHLVISYAVFCLKKKPDDNLIAI